ncbi:hypothetical protein D9758_012181 [Tetrapyrgos nigripes]|uniref:Uncharacterized protein n=1 Tax=Tetrapyrgos nigripes TaxID=182062 RepID=A0A8H5FKU6_9AGAR|nr:hypothetical protein D9758_012181 [Tetrapyrgos nigripes]
MDEQRSLSSNHQRPSHHLSHVGYVRSVDCDRDANANPGSCVVMLPRYVPVFIFGLGPTECRSAIDNSTFIGIAVHNATSSTEEKVKGLDLSAGIRQDANGLLGTTLLLADLVIPFVAGGFLYIGAVAVLPTLLADSKSGKQALREFAAMFFGVLCMFLVAWNE